MSVATEFRTSIDDQDFIARLLSSSEQLSYDPDREIDWDAPLDPEKYGLNPEWSTLFGTPLWDKMSQQQRIELTRHEVGSIMQIGIWFEMILQQMILRDQYLKDPSGDEFRFSLTEIADECRHSLMFAKTCEKLGVPHYVPDSVSKELARGFKATAFGENAYGAILVAEEILDVMQRDWMRGENVLDEVRTSSKIHVVEEARHMGFARHEIRERMLGTRAPRRMLAANAIAIVAYVIVRNLVSRDVYENVGLDRAEALNAVKHNTHHQNLMRLSCVHLMDFLNECRLITTTSTPWYRSVHML